MNKTKHFFIASLFVLNAILAKAQTTFEKTYNWGLSAMDAESVQQTADGGYIMAGFIYPLGSDSQMSLVKTNSNGDTIWTKAIGGSFGFFMGTSVQQTNDLGYIVTGMGKGGDGVYLVKTTAAGDTVWTRDFEKTSTGNEGKAVKQTTDGGYVVTGITNDTIYAAKLGSTGNMTWSKKYGKGKGFSIQETTDGGFIIGGEKGTFNTQAYMIKTNVNGDTLWTKAYGTTSQGAREVVQTSDGGYVLTGYSSGDIYLIKTNSFGNLIWQKTFGGTLTDVGESVKETNDGGYIISGYEKIFDAMLGTDKREMHIIKRSSNGNPVWDRNYGTLGAEGMNVQQTSDKGFAVTGPGPEGSLSNTTFFLLKTDSLGFVTTTGVSNNFANTYDVAVYPNPNSGTCSIQVSNFNTHMSYLTITNLIGQSVYYTQINSDKTEINLIGKPKGLYFYRLEGSDEIIKTGKIIID